VVLKEVQFGVENAAGIRDQGNGVVVHERSHEIGMRLVEMDADSCLPDLGAILRFRRPNRDIANDLAGNELQQTAIERAALWECAETADCRQASLNDTEDGRQLHVIQAAWSLLPLEVRAAMVAIVQAAVPKVGPPTSSD